MASINPNTESNKTIKLVLKTILYIILLILFCFLYMKDALSQFKKAGRDDLAEVEAYEITIIEGFLPAQMEPEELAAFVASLIEQSGAAGMQDMGKVMALLKSQGEGRVDMGKASALVKAQLA